MAAGRQERGATAGHLKLSAEPLTLNRTPPASTRSFPQHLVNVYTIEEQVGQGGFGTVFRCTHKATGEVRALKRMDTNQISVRHIAREVALMRILKHKSVVRCHGLFLEAQYINIVVDLLLGGDLVDGLNKYRQEHGSLPDDRLANLSRQMLAGIVHVHGLGIVHRDIKAENYLISRREIGDPNCHVALADFGVAIRLENNTKLEEQVGTKSFWAPEIWSKRYDFAIDVWALGCTTYILLAGQLPFDAASDEALEREICGERAFGDLPVKLPFFTSRGCKDFIRACLTQDAAERPLAAVVAKQSWLEGSSGSFLDAPTQAQVVKGARNVLDILIDCSGAIVIGCFSGIALCLDIVLSGGQAEQQERTRANKSETAGPSAAVAHTEGSSAVDMAGQIKELERQISTTCLRL